MSIIQFKKKEELVIAFGVRLPEVMYLLVKEIKNRKTTYDIFRRAFNINKNRLINIIEVTYGNHELTYILVIYHNIITTKTILPAEISIQQIDFNVLVLNYNDKIDIEKMLQSMSNI